MNARSQVDVLAVALPRLGYTDESYGEFVRVFISPDGHSVVLIPRTGRVQIRIHYLTPVDARADAAAQVMHELAQALVA